MKLSLVFAVFLAFKARASPVDYRFNLLPDGNGKMHLIDVEPSTIEPEPFFNAEVDTGFLLFTRNNPTEGQRITWSTDSIVASNFNRNDPVRFLIHGFNSGPGSSGSIAPTREYLARGSFNVIVVDWSIGAGTINYVSARNRVPEVANVIARFLEFLVANGFTDLNRVNMAGHSLGAHIAGLTGKRFQGGIQAIYGLDPAGPLFSILSPSTRLAATDAIYTEGIRTNSDNLGFDQPLCQADFYPNWGRSQPGCGIDIAGSCAHSRSHQFFAESITSDRFVAQRCQNYQEIENRRCTSTGTAIMGGHTGKTGISGVFFLQTNSASPFARG